MRFALNLNANLNAIQKPRVLLKASFDFYVEVRVEVLTQNLNALQKARVSLKASFDFQVEVRVEVVTQNLNALQKPRVSLQPSFGFHVEVRVEVLAPNLGPMKYAVRGANPCCSEMAVGNYWHVFVFLHAAGASFINLPWGN